MLITSGLMNQYGWKDNAFALTMLTVYNKTGYVTIIQRRPKKTLTNAKTTQVLFRDQPTKELEILKVYHEYNHKMLEVNITDQLASLNSGQRRIRKGAWQAIDQ
jgi:hypothetical protein